MDHPGPAETVSFVIPAWRRDDFIGPAVASALAQEHPAVEVILVLDGPADLSSADFPADGRLRIVSRAVREGPAAARNAGARAADGEFVSVLDADDLADTARASRQLAEAAASPGVGLVANSARIIDLGGRETGSRAVEDRQAGDVVRALLVRNPFIHSTVMVRRDALASVGGYDESLSRFIDYDLYLRLALAGIQMRGFSDVVGSHRVHGDRLSSRPLPRSVVDSIIRNRKLLARDAGSGLLATTLRNIAWKAKNAHLSHFRR